MRPSRSSLITIGLGLGVLGISLSRISGVGQTAFALFLAAVILVELFEESDRERAREPMQWERFRLAAAVQIAAVIMLGPWAGALVAAAGVLAGGMFRGRAFRNIAFDASAGAIAACVGGLAFEVGGGNVGRLHLLEDLIALVALALVPVAIAMQQVQLRLRSLQRETLRALETFANIVDERDQFRPLLQFPRAGETDPVRGGRATQLAEFLRREHSGGIDTALHCHERLRDGWVELRPGMSLDLEQRRFVREARAIWAVGGHGVEAVGDDQEMRREG